MGTIITLYDESEELFTSLGLGVLNDCVSCEIKETLNDSFELTLEYPIKGSNYSKIKIGRIIGAKPNPYDNMQPFRIASITKPINGVVTVLAYHLSYDMNGIPCKAVDAASLSETLVKIKENCLIENNFSFKTDIQFARKFKTSAPYNVRALLMGDEEQSLIGVYNAELKFDKYSVFLYSKRGKNRGARVCYGNNMMDLTHQSTNERLYNGVFPYYHKETESQETTSSDSFAKAYIVGSKPFQDGWLSFSKNGEAYHPVDSTPVQIESEGEYYQKVYSWNTTYQKYEEKIYNATVSIVEGVIEPSWIVIDWSTFPNVVCRANAKGYYKLATETDWGSIKGVGDIIFQGNILTSGLTNMASNMIIGYSEVLPPNHSSSTETTVSSVDVILDDPIIWLNTTDAKTMKYNKVLSLDLTSEFDEEPSKDKLKSKAEEYINKHLVGTAKHTTTVSFIDLSSTTDSEKYTNFEHVELGDTVKVIYKDLGVDVDLRVISTNYDALKEAYISVELGEKPDKFSATSIQNGDSISSLTNDVGYADITTVNKLIADTVTADYIQAKNASMSNAQIKFLEVAKISCPGILEASQLILDQLVATMLIADTAKIAQTLEAGNIKVAGDISIKSGSINIISDDEVTSFIVDREGNVKANSIEITGGSISIISESGTTFEVNNDGTLYANSAKIEGEIIATAGTIGGCRIIDGELQVDAANISNLSSLIISADNIVGGTIKTSQIKIGEIATNTYNFEVDQNGEVTARNINIIGGEVRISDGSNIFILDSSGDLEANSVSLKGGSIENLDITGNLYFGEHIKPITAYFRNRSITYHHSVTAECDITINAPAQDEVHIVLTTQFDLVGIYFNLEGFYWSDIFDVFDPDYKYDPSFDPNASYTIDASGPNYRSSDYSNFVIDFDQYYNIADGRILNIVDGRWYSGKYDYHNNVWYESDPEFTHDVMTYSKDSNWLSETDPRQNNNQDGPALTPDSTKYYKVYNGLSPYEFIGYFKWNGTSYVEVAEPPTPTYKINQYGVSLPGITATLTSTTIAGFTLSNNRLVSNYNNYEVGLSAAQYDSNAFWAGPTNNSSFYVTRSGEMHATAGLISSFKISQTTNYGNILTSNESKENLFDNVSGIVISSKGIGMYDATYRNKITISPYTGIRANLLYLDPFNSMADINTTFYQVGTVQPLFLGSTTGSSAASEHADNPSDYPADYAIINVSYNMGEIMYMYSLTGIAIPRYSSKTINFYNTSGQIPPGPIASNQIRVYSAIVSNVTNTSGQHGNACTPTVKVDGSSNLITVYNDNSIDVNCDVLILFKNIVQPSIPRNPWA